MKILIEVELNQQALEMSWVRQHQMVHTIAQDVGYMMNEKHQDVYRSTHLYTEEGVDF